MTSKLSEAERKEKYSHYVTGSPLKHSTMVIKSHNEKKTKAKKTEKIDNLKVRREKSFVLDGVYEHVHKSSVLPSYNAIRDPHAQTYFRQPAIQVLMTKSSDHNLIPPAIPSHKLSTRERIPNTPGNDDLNRRESSFVIDSVRSDTMKSNRSPVIPKYDALDDQHAQKYFRKSSVKSLLQQTCNIKIK